MYTEGIKFNTREEELAFIAYVKDLDRYSMEILSEEENLIPDDDEYLLELANLSM